MTTSLVPAQLPLRFSNALRVECRKLLDTRVTQFVLAGGVALMAAFAIGLAAISSEPTQFTQVVTTGVGPATWLVYVLASVLVAQEFGRGTATHTFTLDPRRTRVVLAKAFAVTLGCLVLVGVALGLALVAQLVSPMFGGPAMDMSLQWGLLARCIGGLCFAGLVAAAWALLLRSLAAPLVLLLLWPTASHILQNLSIAPALAWVDIEPVWSVDGSAISWAQLATSTLFWLVLPAVVGIVRLVKSDL